eukprot:snap_masked-scaffold_13-processed-gene-4.48-mRNA-1 protein AED:1.00 eAED:1.00 QI:0/-1/0/0/-1/1/1/0/483
MPIIGVSVRSKCHICNKTVGFAESVHHNSNVYHAGCYRCVKCNKKLQRGLGLLHSNQLHCHNCHAKAVGPMVFAPRTVNLESKRKTLRKLVSARQPQFAHTAAAAPLRENPRKAKARAMNLAKAAVTKIARSASMNTTESDHPPQSSAGSVSSNKSGGKVHHLEVAIFQGKTMDTLKDFLKVGELDTSEWKENHFRVLLGDLVNGHQELGLDANGKVLLTASKVKILMHDEENDAMLFTPFSAPIGSVAPKAGKRKLDVSSRMNDAKINIYPQVLEMSKIHFPLDGDMQIFEKNLYDDVLATLGMSMEKAPHTKGSSGVNSGDILPMETFTLSETPLEAAARSLADRLGLKNAKPRMFNRKVVKKVISEQSAELPGLRCETHVYHVLLKSKLVKPLQKTLPLNAAIPLQRQNQHISEFYVWLKRGDVIASLEEVYGTTEGFRKVVGEVKFDSVFVRSFCAELEKEFVDLGHWVQNKNSIDRFL